jgi:hypothetical protein
MPASSRWLARIAAKVDRYGAAFFIGSRFSGVLLTMTLFGLLRAGSDITPWLQASGVASIEEVVARVGQWAGAVVLASVVFPFSLLSTGWLAARVAALGNLVVRPWMRSAPVPPANVQQQYFASKKRS